MIVYTSNTYDYSNTRMIVILVIMAANQRLPPRPRAHRGPAGRRHGAQRYRFVCIHIYIYIYAYIYI